MRRGSPRGSTFPAAVPIAPGPPFGPTTPISGGWIAGLRLTGSRIIRRLEAVTVSLLLLTGLAAPAHDALTTHIAHHLQVVIGPANIDVTLELAFHETPSLAERRQMDTDEDGRIGSHEIETYLARLEPELGRRVTLAWRDRPLPLIPLHQPRLDFRGPAVVAPAHHLLHLRFFARTPPGLQPGDHLVLTDRLWPECPALRFVECPAVPHPQGFRLEPGPPDPSVVPASGPVTAGVVRLRVEDGPARTASRLPPPPPARP